MFKPGTSERKKLKKSDVLLKPGTDNIKHVGAECLVAIHMCQTELNLIDEKMTQEKRATSRKYDTLKIPLYDRRTELTRTLTDFWVACLENHPQLSYLIDNDEVQKVLQHMVKIEAEDNIDNSTGANCKLHFYFEENPYIENKRLTKEVILCSENSSMKSSSTPIRWKKVMGFLQRKDKHNIPAGSKIRRHKRYLNFFEWFSDDEYIDDYIFSYFETISNNPLPYSPFFFSDVENDLEMDVLDDEVGGVVDSEVSDILDVVVEDVVHNEDGVELQRKSDVIAVELMDEGENYCVELEPNGS